MLERLLPAALAVMAASPSGPGPAAAPPGEMERVTFEEAIQRATERNPSVGQAAQAILRAQALVDQASSVFRPFASGAIGQTILDDARGFNGTITQPRNQSAFSATVSYAFLAASDWAAKNQAADQVGTARISAQETRRQVALAAAQAYLAVIATKRQREIAMRTRDTARVLADYSGARLQAGQGSRLNHLRSSQELSTAEGLVELAELAVRQSQEALGVALFADLPVDAEREPEMTVALLPSSDDLWLTARPDVRLASAELDAADRVVRDAWKDWLPTGVASFTPRYVTPASAFEPSKTWRALFQLQFPIYDGTISPAKRVNIADRETARLRLDALRVEARAEVRVAQVAVIRIEQIVARSREAASSAVEALRITEIAYKAGATSNLEVVQAQQTARNLEIITAQAEDRLRQARLDLLVALGQFPP